MKINLVSDLHLEFSDIELPGGEILILAGDICEIKNVKSENYDFNGIMFPFEDSAKRPDRYIRFFKEECIKYDRVFYVMGNHEHYHGRFDQTEEKIRAFLPSNCTLLNNEVIEYNGTMFLGATLWTDFNKHNPITLYEMKSCMNDYKTITNFYKDKNYYNKLTTSFIYNEHKKSLKYFKNILGTNKDKPFIIITHHAPSFMSVNAKYKHDFHMNGGYASDLSELILDNTNIKTWVHGHMHDKVDYMIGDTRVLANPRGYVPYESGNGFKADFYFEV